tara:strand:- start:440 stop:1156 length:717 start_codon:yes stop_codon:yes gene_type:complete
MHKIEINFSGIKESIFTESDIFQPNLTSQLSYETAIKLIKNNYKVLDLGCGTGIIGVMIMKKLPQVEMHCSDVDEKSIKYAKKNFTEKKMKADIRKGYLLNIWKDKKFDYIINDVSGISSTIAKKSIWFNNVPCNTGEDGSKLSIEIIKNASNYLNKNGLIQFPVISLSNVKKIIEVAKTYFSKVEIHSTKDWFLPKEMESLKEVMYKLKNKNHIDFNEKFGKIICNTSIVVCKQPVK